MLDGNTSLSMPKQCATAAKVAKLFRQLLEQQTSFVFPLSLQDQGQKAGR